MHAHLRLVSHIILALVVCAILGVSGAVAAPTTYSAVLTGPAESPPNASPAIGNAQVQIDPVAHTMVIHVTFSGLLGTTTQAHIHGPTAVAGTGTAGVMTTTPYFAGWPVGATSGSFDITMNTLAASSYNPTFVTNNGGTPATAEVAMFNAISSGKSYFNIHSQSFPGGEIRGFLVAPVATENATWGGVKALYR
jgi:CHRD domain